MDPLAELYFSLSPYNYVASNPLKYVDPDGRHMSPIYGLDGNFLGTDDQGLSGDFIVMDKRNFRQGMSHDEALKHDVGLDGATDYKAGWKIWHSYFGSLKDRPDYDGFVSISEGVEWAKKHPDALRNPTAWNTLYIDASKLDFGNITEDRFRELNTVTPINTLNEVNFTASSSNPVLRATVYALGRVDMKLLDRATRTVSIVNNEATDYDWNSGGGKVRSTLIHIERTRTGLRDGMGFKTYYYGTGVLNEKRSYTPQYPKVGEPKF